MYTECGCEQQQQVMFTDSSDPPTVSINMLHVIHSIKQFRLPDPIQPFNPLPCTELATLTLQHLMMTLKEAQCN